MSVSTSTPPAPPRCRRRLPDPRDCPPDLLPRVIDIVVPADRHGCEVRQIADDHLRGVHQLRGELPVRDDDDAKLHV